MPTLKEKAEGRALWIKTIKNQNQDKNFVQRMEGMNNPKAYNLKFPRVENHDKDNTHSTHIIASGEDEDSGKEMLFPTVVQPTKSKKLVKLPVRDAARYAKKTGENIMFNSPEQADEFAKHYKE